MKPMPAWSEMIADRAKGREEALGVSDRLESSQSSFAFTSRLMRILGPIIQAPALPLFNVGHDLLSRYRVALKLIGHYGPRRIA
jgi:hypothetical protein